MRLVVVTSCTNNKRYKPTRGLAARTLPRAGMRELAEEWVRRVRGAKPIDVAEKLYCGRAFSEASQIATSGNAELLIVSAGLGLVSGSQPVPAYSLTVSPGSPDSIGERCRGEDLRPNDWWCSLHQVMRKKSPLAPRIAKDSNRLWLFAIPTKYFEMLKDDLDQLPDRALARVRIIGPRLPMDSHRILAHTLIEFDDRLDGPQSPMPGTRADFPQRAASLFFERILRDEPHAGILAHRRQVAKLLTPMRFPRRPKRVLRSDGAIRTKIKKLWWRGKGRSSKLLRLLRDREQTACEQGRFRALFKIVKQELGE